MKKEELIVGEYYLGNYGHRKYLMIYNGNDNCTSLFINLDYDKFGNSGSFRIKEFNYQRPATQEEKNWLNACIEANKFIPFDKVNQSINYEIY